MITKATIVIPSHWTIVRKASGSLRHRNYLNSRFMTTRKMNNVRCSSPSEQRGTCDTRLKIDTTRHPLRNMREREAMSYLKRKGIHDIVDFLLGELLLRRPYDPYEYMIQLLDRRILTRDGLIDSPPPFSSR